jgi:hypothetical protein
MSRFVVALVACACACACACATTACGGAATTSVPPAELTEPPEVTPAPSSVDATTFTGKQVKGPLPPEQIRSVVIENLQVFRDCYDKARRANPKLQGKVTVKLEIDPDGVVRRSADARSDLPDAPMVECVVDAYRTLRFPKPNGGVVTVYFPLLFNPRD